MKYSNKLARHSLIIIISLSVAVFVSQLRPGEPVNAQPTGTTSGSLAAENEYRDLEKRIETFFGELQAASSAGKPFEDLLKGGPLSRETEMFAEMGKSLGTIQQQFGAYRSNEQISVRTFGKQKDLLIMRYLYKCEHHPVVWYFTFYRSSPPSTSTTPGAGAATTTGGNWNIIGIRFDTDLDKLTSP